MKQVKLAIIYYSTYGTNYQMAKWAKEEAETLGAEVRLLQVTELAPQAVIDKQAGWKANQEATKDIPVASADDLDWADAYLFSMPTRFGSMPSQMKQFLDIQGGLWSKGALANKMVGAMTSAQNDNGGQEATLLSFFTTMFHWGSLVVTPGYLDPASSQVGGNPYGTSITVDGEGNLPEGAQGAVVAQTKRLLDVTSQFIS
jgi:NAD(P)H dehydrogenase (quinone)